jgi:hypothetical protein
MAYSPTEDVDIARVATEQGIDWRFLKALRRTENGGPGREFGVLAVPAPSWTDQATIAARTIRHTLGRYWENVRKDPWGEAARGYQDDFVRYFSQGGPGWAGYCPLHAPNDPTNLNPNHARNLLAFYAA